MMLEGNAAGEKGEDRGRVKLETALRGACCLK
jgi:hypothetical protein